MDKLSFEQFDECAAAFDDTVLKTEEIDRFCSSSAWIRPAQIAFVDDTSPMILRSDNGWAALMTMPTVLGRTLVPLECTWGLASPILGVRPSVVVTELHQVLHRKERDWQALYLPGLKRGGAAFTALLHRFALGYRIGLGRETIRHVASLDGGFEGWMSRRSARFRKNMRRVERNATAYRFRPERVGGDRVKEIYAQIVAIERRSWKGRSGNGIDQGRMNRFYGEMLPRLASRDGLRVIFAEREGEDVGFVFGGLFGDTYRGLQMSFDDEHRVDSVGNLLQLASIRQLADEGVALYDLGSEMAYKQRWAEERQQTIPLVIR